MILVKQVVALGVLFIGTNTTAFLKPVNIILLVIKWPWSFVYPGSGATTTTTAVGAASINYGFLRPAIIVPVPTTTAAPTTTTTTTARPTTPLSQYLINAILASGVTVPATSNNSLLVSLANALANRPVVGGLAQPYPIFGGGTTGGITGGIVSGGFGGVAQAPPAVIGGIAAPPGVGGGIVLPNGFPASGGLVASGVLPGFPGLFPSGIIGRSGGGIHKGQSGRGNGNIIFDSSKKRK